jgi:hypothetical protein
LQKVVVIFSKNEGKMEKFWNKNGGKHPPGGGFRKRITRHVP